MKRQNKRLNTVYPATTFIPLCQIHSELMTRVVKREPLK
ncbi:MAG: hypothetical protein UU47_C0002G0052 [candidate division TM6 bacterium GW2011_GWE2_41_16]|nr:MAG: hypothetical protein UU47_C0002G0052 [candidate division TM6 bacterium GW2011_GWE2_41_16]